MDFLKYRFITYTLSFILLAGGVFGLFSYGLNLSTEFTGGTRFVFSTSSDNQVIENLIKDVSHEYTLEKQNENFVLFFEEALPRETVTEISDNLELNLEGFDLNTLQTIEPSIGQELIQKTLIAVVFSVLVIFIFIAYSFKNFLSSVTAVIAMLHDTFILLGLFSYFSMFLGAEIDLLFVTAVLTVLSFSLYDTIVIFDKVREIRNKGAFGNDYYKIVNKALEQTMVRSINNSLTSIIALYALSLFVDGSLYWFALALLLGVILGTYSSPFVASTLFYDIGKKMKSRN